MTQHREELTASSPTEPRQHRQRHAQTKRYPAQLKIYAIIWPVGLESTARTAYTSSRRRRMMTPAGWRPKSTWQTPMRPTCRDLNQLSRWHTIRLYAHACRCFEGLDDRPGRHSVRDTRGLLRAQDHPTSTDDRPAGAHCRPQVRPALNIRHVVSSRVSRPSRQ